MTAAIAGPSEPPERSERLRRCRAGQAEAWEQLLAEVRPLAALIARREYGLGLEDQDDVCQLVSLKVYENLRQLRDTGAFRPWLRSLTRRVIVDYLRQRRETTSLDYLEENFGMEPAEVTSEPIWVEQATTRVELERALGLLPELYRAPVLLYLLEGIPQDEVSRRLHRPRSTVASQIHRGLARLRRSLSL